MNAIQREISKDPVYLELKKEYTHINPEAIEMLMQFFKVVTIMNIKREMVFSSNGLTAARFHILMYLKQESGLSLSPSELAKRVGVSRGTMTQFIDAIEKEKLAERIEDPKDKRGMQVKLTEKGLMIINQILPTYFSFLEKSTEVLTKQDRENWLQILEKLTAGLHDKDA